MVNLDDILAKINQLDRSDKIDLLRASIENFGTLVTDVITKQKSLESRVDLLTTENTYLKAQLEIVNSELDRMKQHTLNSNIEIAGVPETVNNTPEEVSKKILSHLGFTEIDTIKNAYRKKGYTTRAGLPQPIIVTIRDKGTRDKILREKRKLNTNLYTDILSTSEESSDNHRIIYLNEHLTDHNKYLFKKTKDLRRAGKIFSTWVRNGYIFIKESENSIDKRITTFVQVDEINGRN